MIKKEDIIVIKLKQEWFKKGLDYALMSWTSIFNRMGKSNPYSRIQKIILGIIAEEAFEQYLIDNNISYEKNGRTKWYEEDRYDIGIKKFVIDVKANFLDLNSAFIQSKISNLFEDKYTWFTKCHALVPLDQLNPGNNKKRVHMRNKIYIFPFIEGISAISSKSKCLVHSFWDYKWLKRSEHKNLSNLGNLNINYNGSLNDSYIIIYGTLEQKKACIERLYLNKKTLQTKNDFFQVFSILWCGKPPSGLLTIQSKSLKLEESVKPLLSFILKPTKDGYWPIENNWQNLWLDNCTIYLLGWIYEEDFRVIGKKYPRFTHTIEQYAETKVDNWGCFISELEPIGKIKSV